MEYPKVTEKILNCSLGEETSAFEAYWDQQEQLAPLELRRDDSPPQRSAYRVLESVGRQKAFKHPRATVEFVRDQKRTRFRMLINRHWAGAQGGNYFQLDPNWLVLIRSEERVPVAEETEEFSGSECYVPFPEEVLEAVPAEFETFLHSRGITMENGKPTQPKLLESIPPTPAEPEPIEHGYSLEGKTMPNRAIFCLNTSAYNFAQWLERHTSVKEFPSKRGWFVLQRARAGGSFHKSDRITIDSAFYTLSRDDEQREILHFAGVEAVHFGVTDIGTERDSRIEVDALCINSFMPIRAYFHDLLAEIARTWPESAQPIGELAQASARETGVDTLQSAAATPSGDHAGEGERAVESTPLLEDWPAWMPQRTNGELLQTWSDIASIWEDMQEEYRDELVRDSRPRLEDLRERVIEELGVKYSIRRLSTILRAKNGGYLDQAQRKKKRRV